MPSLRPRSSPWPAGIADSPCQLSVNYALEAIDLAPEIRLGEPEAPQFAHHVDVAFTGDESRLELLDRARRRRRRLDGNSLGGLRLRRRWNLRLARRHGRCRASRSDPLPLCRLADHEIVQCERVGASLRSLDPPCEDRERHVILGSGGADRSSSASRASTFCRRATAPASA